MKNLLNKISLERIDTIPTKQRKRQSLGTKFKVKVDIFKSKWDNRNRTIIYQKIDRIIIANIGQDWNDIYSKIVKVCKNLPYDFDIKFAISRVNFAYWNTKKNEWYVHSKYYEHRSLKKVITERSQTKWWRQKFMYVNPENNILTFIPPTYEPPMSKEQKRISTF